MPRYRYACKDCNSEKVVFHRIMASPEVMCAQCNGAMFKGLTTPHIVKSSTGNETNTKVGELTHEYIEENRKLLEEEKSKAKEKIYEQT